MKKLLLIYLSSVALIFNAQNLISNPSFEIHSSCPTDLTQLENAIDWYQPFNYGSNLDCSTSDLYDYCSSNSMVVPNTAIFGAITPRTGNSCAGFAAYTQSVVSGNDLGYREYIENQLVSPLVAGQEYCISLWLRFSSASVFSTSSFGIKFSQTIIDLDCSSNYLPLTTSGYPPDVLYTGSFLTDVSNWTELTFSYTAAGGEQYFIFGNFSELGASSVQSTGVPSNMVLDECYYYVDDVSVVAGTCTTSNTCNPSISSVASLCESDANITLTADITGGTWSGTGIIDVNTGEFSPSNAGAGTFNIVYTAPCGNSANINISVWSNLDCDANGGGNGSGGELPSTSIGVPSVFSPNNDGQNDVLSVLGEGIKSIKFKIFNRYGVVVFESLDQNFGWDGTFKGKMENSGVFVYTLEYEFVNGESGFLKGNVTLKK